MTSLLDEVTTFVGDCPHATFEQIRERFGSPVWSNHAVGTYKVYIDAVYLRGVEFVHIQHRTFGREQVIRARRVEPMERVRTEVVYAPCLVGDENEAGWVAETALVGTVEAFMEALGASP